MTLHAQTTTVPDVETGERMEFYDGHRDDEFDEFAVEREDGVARARRLTPGWTLILLSLVAYTVVLVAQGWMFSSPFRLLFTLTTLLTLLAGGLLTAGVVLIVLRRWLLPDLVEAVRDDVEPAGTAEPPAR